MFDPLERWRRFGEKPGYAGLLTFAGMPYTQDKGELAGVHDPDGGGFGDATALVAERMIREELTGIAMRRSAT